VEVVKEVQVIKEVIKEVKVVEVKEVVSTEF
jgi:hypothetical protein